MTGFGKSVVESENLTVTVEVKSLNSKFTDIYCRLPRSLSSKEIELRNLLTQELERGKIDFSVLISRTGETTANVTVNRPLIAAYVKDLGETSQLLNLPPTDFRLFELALTMPNAYNTDAQPEAEAESDWQLVQQGVKQAIKACNEFRLREGAIVVAEFKRCIGVITDRLEKVKTQDVLRIPAVRERLHKAVSDLLQDDNFDKNRFEQELIYYIEKFDISEEKVRLSTHLNYFVEVLGNESSGKKLNFIAQEIGREINTIGSKANDAIIQRYVVEMKDELEKIKEQTANIL